MMKLRYIIFDLIEFYFTQVKYQFVINIYDKYNYFIKRISDTKKFNLDEEILFIEFE